jgi:hypothetical protein
MALEYPNALQQSLVLATNGYVENIARGHFPKYRMTELFIKHLEAA